jgi:hypothetical protein|tara:strand:+ start:977 stop:1204 length:228 start_codon:yes stop_codon:yes gene_type:complete
MGTKSGKVRMEWLLSAKIPVAGKGSDVANDLKNLNILLVEDDPSMRLLLRDMLSAFCVEKLVAVRDGTKAFSELR